jgi:hypothetical protein
VIRSVLLLAALLGLSGCTGRDALIGSPTNHYVLLAPDWRNDVIHRIALDGTYEGDLFAAGRAAAKDLNRGVWGSPRGLLLRDGNLWLTAERALSEWGADGRYIRTLYSNSSQLEDPTGIVAVGDDTFVVSEDKKILLVFDREGALVHSFGYPNLDRADDIKLGPDGMLYVGSRLRSPETPLISIWDPKIVDEAAQPVGHRIRPDMGEEGTISVTGLVFDDAGDLLITDFVRGRLERWDLETDSRKEVLLDSDQWGTYRDLERGPDGKIYMSGPAGIYRFDPSATAATLAGIQPFFDARSIAGRYQHEFSPEALVFVPRALLAPVAENE